ncbi:MAG: PKD domain-containing protein [Sphingobacteriales bacterium]|nr:MAG: PKD domain-containing protein [Sphingobacteriales bacterium]
MIKSLLLTLSLCCFIAIIVHAQPNPCDPDSSPVIVSADITNACGNYWTPSQEYLGSISVNAANGTLPYTYSWSHDLTLNSPIATGFPVGTYCVTVTDVNGCYVSECFDVEPIVNITIESDPVIYCDTPYPTTYTLTAYGSGGFSSYNYLWNTGSTTQSITTSPSTPTTYTVTVTDSNGCTNSLSIGAEGNIPVQTEPATCGLCNGSIGVSQDNSYLVTGNGLGSGTTLSGPFVLGGLCPGNYQVQTVDGGCSTPAPIVNINLPFSADAAFNTSIGNADVLYACTGQNIQFTASESNLQVNWDFGEPTSLTNTSTLFNPTYIYQNAGTYTVTLYAEGCTDADTLIRTVVIEQGIAPDITCASLVCPGEEETYTTSAVCDNYNWTVTGGNIIAGQNTAGITVVWDDIPEGTVELTIGDCDGSTVCDPTGSILVPVISNNHQIEGPALVCQGDYALYSVPQYGGVTYNWSIVPPSAGEIVWQSFNQAGINWISDGVVRVGMSSFLLDCTSVNELPVEVNLKYQINGTENVCAGSQITCSASIGVHNWTVSGNASIVGNSTNVNSVVVEAGDDGSFTVTAMPVNIADYCNYPQQFQTNITPLPAIPVVTGNLLVCSGNGYSYQIAAPVTGLIYLWTVTGGTPASGNGTSKNIVWQPGFDEYNISVVAQSINEPFCESEPGSLVAVPLQNLQITGTDQICAGEKASYTATPLLDDIDYVWTISPPEAGSVIGGQGSNIIEVQWNSGIPDALLTVSACGISAQTGITIFQTITPVIVQSGILCAGSSVQLSVLPDTYSAYQWNNPAVTGNTVTITNSGNYIVTVTDSNGCQTIGTYSIQSVPLPDAYIYVEGENTFCTNNPQNVNINALVGEGFIHEWLVNNIPVGNNTPIITHTGTNSVSSTSYSVLVTDSNGCQNLSNNVSIIQMNCGIGSPPPPDCPGCPICYDCVPPGPGPSICYVAPGTVVSLTALPTSDCNTIDFTNNSTATPYGYSWDFGDGSPIVTVPDTAPQTHVYNQPGYYLARIFANYPSVPPTVPLACALVGTEPVFIRHKAGFETAPFCFNTPTQFIDYSVHIPTTVITTWFWEFGDGTNSTETNPEHLYAAPGDYNVTLTIGDGVCNSSITKTVTVKDLPDATFTTPATVCEGTPAAFTPAVNPDAILWDWTFGNGAAVSTQFPEQSYLTAGTYNVNMTVTDNIGCTNSGVQTIEVLPVNSGTISLSPPTACGWETITLTAPTGATYQWSNAMTSGSISVWQSGIYNVTVTQSNGCQFTTPSAPVNIEPLPPAVISPNISSLVLCPGTSVTLNADAGPSYLYSWSNGMNSPSVTIHHSGIPASGINLHVTVTDPESGCFNVSDVVNLQRSNINPPHIYPYSSYLSPYLHICEGESVGLTATHLSLSNFVWNTGHVGNIITVDSPGTYTVSVTNADGCVAANSKTVLVNSGGDMSAIPVGCYDFCELDTFMVPNIYTGYQWLLNGLPVAGATSNEFVPPQSGDYQLQITTVWGCKDTSDVISLNLLDCLDCIVSSSFIFENNCTEVLFTSLSDGNGTLEYEWNFGDGNTSSIPNPIHVYSFSGNYNVCLTTINTAADADVCSETYCETITVFGAEILNITTDSVTDAACGDSDGMIQITVSGVSPPYQFMWSDMSTDEDRFNLPVGVYDLTVTDAGGCSVTASFTIAGLPIDASTLNCLNVSNNELTVYWETAIGATGYEISLDGDVPITLTPDILDYTFTGLSPDTDYTIILLALAPPSCNNGLPAQVTCTTLPDPCAQSTLSAVTIITDADCGETNGSISLNISDGQPPYTYLWNDFSTDANLTNIGAGSYAVTVTDALGCTASAIANVSELITTPVLTCLSATETEIVITWEMVIGATGYEISLNGDTPIALLPDVIDYTFTGLAPDTEYTISLLVLAPPSCNNGQPVQVTCTTLPDPCAQSTLSAVTIIADADCGETNGSISLNISDGQPPYTYLWNDFSADASLTNIGAGSYSVTVTDALGCTVSAIANVSELITMPVLICLSATQTEIVIAWEMVIGAIGYEISLNGNTPIALLPDVIDYTFTGLATDTDYTFTLNVLMLPTCINSEPAQITCTTLPDPCAQSTLSAVTIITDADCGETNGGISLNISDGQPPYTYLWSNFSADASLTNIGAGSYGVTVTDALGCTASATANVSELITTPVLTCLSATENEIVIAWETVSGATGYEISLNGNTPIALLPDVLDYTFTGLAPDTEYTFSFTVSASENCGAGNTTVVSCMTEQYICLTESIGATLSADLLLVQYGEPVTLSVNAFGLWGSLTYEWTAGGLPFACQDSICTFYPLDPTTYTVLVTDIFGCTASASIDIDVRMPNRMLIPNAFSPNGDAINNIFRVAGYNIESYRLSVWNRMGQKVYDGGYTSDISQGWDGRYHGKDAELGVYNYIANVRYKDGTEENLKGNVTLIR